MNIRTSPLARAIASFNAAFGYRVALPVEGRFLDSLAEIATRRGEPAIAQALRDGLAKAEQPQGVMV